MNTIHKYATVPALLGLGVTAPFLVACDDSSPSQSALSPNAVVSPYTLTDGAIETPVNVRTTAAVHGDAENNKCATTAGKISLGSISVNIVTHEFNPGNDPWYALPLSAFPEDVQLACDDKAIDNTVYVSNRDGIITGQLTPVNN